jgi:hypothetical protein
MHQGLLFQVSFRSPAAAAIAPTRVAITGVAPTGISVSVSDA